MPLTQIVCIPDLLRGTRAFPEGFFDLVREPIVQGCAIDIGYPPNCKRGPRLEGFDPSHFRRLADWDEDHVAQSWSRTYHTLAAAALDYLFDRIPTGALVLSFEMPPWLQAACLARGVNFLDLRASPLRFGRDLYIAVCTSDAKLFERIAAHAVGAEELRLEASVLAANVRMHLLRQQESGQSTAEDLDGSLIFVGQAPYDASILALDGRTLRGADFADRLRTLARERRLRHKAHPFANGFGEEERAVLAELVGYQVEACHGNAYQILSSHDDLELVGISSGMLQEAPWFSKRAHTLFQPYVPLSIDPSASPRTYQQIRFQDLIAPSFWHKVLTPDREPPRLAALPALAHHHARETIDQWWDYEKVLTWRRSLPHASFERLGGGLLRERIETLEQSLQTLRS